MARRRSYTPEDSERVVALRAEGVSWADIGKQLNLQQKLVDEAYEAGTSTTENASRLMQLFDKLQDKLLATIDTFTLDEISDLAPNQRAILFGIMMDKVAPLQKVLGDSLGADHFEVAPTMRQLMQAAPTDLKELDGLIGRMRTKVSGSAKLAAIAPKDDEEDGDDDGA